MNELLAVLRHLAARNTVVEFVGQRIRQLSGPTLSTAAHAQLAKCAQACWGTAAAPVSSRDLHVVVDDADVQGFVDAVTSSSIVGVSVAGDVIAIAADGHRVELVGPHTRDDVLRDATSLLAQLDAHAWGATGLPGVRDLVVAATVLERVGASHDGLESVDAVHAGDGRGGPGGREAPTLGQLVADARVTQQRAAWITAEVDALGLRRVVDLEEKVVAVLARASSEGVPVDEGRLNSLTAMADAATRHHAERVSQKLGVAFNSPELLRRLNDVGCDVTSVKTDELACRREEFDVVDEILRARAEFAVYSQIGRPWSEQLKLARDGHVHPQYTANLETGRMSSSRPNVMGLPRDPRVRGVVTARDGYALVAVDYRASQLRIVSSVYRVERLRQLFRDGQDPHSWTASRYFRIPPESVATQQREFGKFANFSLLYGVGVDTFMAIGRADYGLHLRRHEAEELMAAFFDSYPEIAEWHADEARTKTTFTVTPLGRRLWLTRPGSTFNGRLSARIQAIEADALKTAMVQADPSVRAAGGRLLFPIHDALVYAVPRAHVARVATAVSSVMVVAMESMIDVPAEVEVKVGPDWGALWRLDLPR